MLNSILYSAFLKIHKENRQNNYIYSDYRFPKKLIEQKAKEEKQKPFLYGNVFNLDKIHLLQKSKTTKMKETKEIFKKINNQRNKENKLNTIKKINIIHKTDLSATSILPIVNSDKNRNFWIKDTNIKLSIKKFNIEKIKDYHLTPRKQKSCLLDEEVMKKISDMKKKLNKQLNSTINFHILKINSPDEPLQKSMTSTIFNLENFSNFLYNKRFQKIIRLNHKKKTKATLQKSNEDEKNSKIFLKKIKSKMKSDLIKNESKNKKNNLSSSFPKYSDFRPKLYPMIQIDNFREKYISINELNNQLNKQDEDTETKMPLYKNMFSSNNNDIYYYAVNKMYSSQIKEYMKHRINWEFVSSNNLDKNITINFSWRYYSNKINYKKFQYNPELLNNNSCSLKKLRMVNLFERNYEVGNKKNMFLNLINYCDKQNINVFSIVPFTVIINNTPEVGYALEALKEIISFVNKNKSYDEHIITNRKYNEHFWFDKNYDDINKQYINIDKNFLSEKNYWILKPTDLYQGKCIEIFSEFSQIYKQCKNIFRGIKTKVYPNIFV